MQGTKGLGHLVDTELNQEWLSTLSDLRPAGRVSFKRCYAKRLGGNEVKSLHLHCFALDEKTDLPKFAS